MTSDKVAAEHKDPAATTAKQKLLEIPPADPLRKAFEVIQKQRAETEQLREQLSTAASVAAGLRLTASAAYENIIATIDEIEINRIMTTEERRWVNRLRRTAKNLDPYPEERDDE